MQYGPDFQRRRITVATMMSAELHHAHERLTEIFGDRSGMFVSQLHHHARTTQPFDATFYEREPILEVTLSDDWACSFCSALSDEDGRRAAKLLCQIIFSDGSAANLSEIWSLNYMPSDLDTAGVDLARGEEVIGLGGETVRHIVRETYRCKSRAEEDFFIARWIAS
jgi:hypothetical protein